MTNSSIKFVCFVGPFLYGKNVAVYQRGDNYALRAETITGRQCGIEREISAEQYMSMIERWGAGLVGSSDARATQRALAELWPDKFSALDDVMTELCDMCAGRAPVAEMILIYDQDKKRHEEICGACRQSIKPTPERSGESW